MLRLAVENTQWSYLQTWYIFKSTEIRLKHLSYFFLCYVQEDPLGDVHYQWLTVTIRLQRTGISRPTQTQPWRTKKLAEFRQQLLEMILWRIEKISEWFIGCLKVSSRECITRILLESWLLNLTVFYKKQWNDTVSSKSRLTKLIEIMINH